VPIRMRESLTRWIPKRPQARLEALFWVVLSLVVGYRTWPQVAATLGVASASREAPAFRLTTLDGMTVSRESLRGKVILVNVWATWCLPCRVEMPGFQSVYDRKRAEGFTIVGISTDAAGPQHVARYLSEHGITYPVAMAEAGVERAFGEGGVVPTSYLIDRRGRIRYTVTGIFASPALEQAVSRLLAEPAGASKAADASSSAAGEGGEMPFHRRATIVREHGPYVQR
jgi:cytochrome c biogenesis protein CcmG/thiol:disulfide interchange protein DsbE